jgi:hypothetical protein
LDGFLPASSVYIKSNIMSSYCKTGILTQVATWLEKVTLRYGALLRNASLRMIFSSIPSSPEWNEGRIEGCQSQR